MHLPELQSLGHELLCITMIVEHTHIQLPPLCTSFTSNVLCISSGMGVPLCDPAVRHIVACQLQLTDAVARSGRMPGSC
jgi:hypothetical protein